MQDVPKAKKKLGRNYDELKKPMKVRISEALERVKLHDAEEKKLQEKKAEEEEAKKFKKFIKKYSK